MKAVHSKERELKSHGVILFGGTELGFEVIPVQTEVE